MQCSDFVPVTPRDHYYYHHDNVERANQEHRSTYHVTYNGLERDGVAKN